MRRRFTLSRLFIVVTWLAVCTWLGASTFHWAPKLWPLELLLIGSAAVSGTVGLIRETFADWLVWGLAIPVLVIAVIQALA